MRRKNPWRDDKGNYLPSKSSQKFLDKLELVFGCKIEREFKIQYGPRPHQVRFYDGRYGRYLFELDGKLFHRTKRQQANDKFKDALAIRSDMQVVRLPLNSEREVDKLISANISLLKEVFEENRPQTVNIIDRLQEVC